MTNRSLLVPLVCLALAACAPKDAPDFCKNHALFHAEHAASNATLQITLTADGGIDSELHMPVAVVDSLAAEAVLQDASRVFRLQTSTACSAMAATVVAADDALVATYAADCGADNKLGQIDVLLFDELPELHEVDVLVVTPATQKHFAINRQCGSAIFRLK